MILPGFASRCTPSRPCWSRRRPVGLRAACDVGQGVDVFRRQVDPAVEDLGHRVVAVAAGRAEAGTWVATQVVQRPGTRLLNPDGAHRALLTGEPDVGRGRE